jgi:hypothetical protein
MRIHLIQFNNFFISSYFRTEKYQAPLSARLSILVLVPAHMTRSSHIYTCDPVPPLNIKNKSRLCFCNPNVKTLGKPPNNKNPSCISVPRMTAPHQNEKRANGGFFVKLPKMPIRPQQRNKTCIRRRNLSKETWDMLCANAFGARRRVTDVQSTLCRSEKLNCSSNVLIARYAFPWGFPWSSVLTPH